MAKTKRAVKKKKGPALMTGRASVFRNKNERLQGFVTKRAIDLLGWYRLKLSKIAKREPRRLSQAEVIEYVLRGEKETRAYIAGRIHV